jgi:anthranilate phosphoribosyltransferase
MTTIGSLTDAVADDKELTASQIADAVHDLLNETVGDEAKADFLTALARKGETASEIAGFAKELRAHAVDPHIDAAGFGGVVLDVCGTGADMANTFNISSCVTFVVAAAGIAVAKHGNRGITSRSGSADVLAALGAKIELAPDAARRCLEEVGVTFLFAQAFHPAFKKIAPVRRQLAERKQRTVFNILGPLVNPARPTHQVVGIFDRALVGKYAEVLRLLGVKRALVVNGDGLDEFSTMGPNYCAELWSGRIEETVRDFRVPASQLRLMPVQPYELAGADPAGNAAIARGILQRKECGPKRDIVALNAAAALVVAGKADDFAAGWKLAAELIDSGAAAEKLARFVEATNRL